jgi:hypothetical protein
MGRRAYHIQMCTIISALSLYVALQAESFRKAKGLELQRAEGALKKVVSHDEGLTHGVEEARLELQALCTARLEMCS